MCAVKFVGSRVVGSAASIGEMIGRFSAQRIIWIGAKRQGGFAEAGFVHRRDATNIMRRHIWGEGSRRDLSPVAVDEMALAPGMDPMLGCRTP